MGLRNRHLACLFLLLSTLGAAQASASPASPSFCGHNLHALLYRHALDVGRERAAGLPPPARTVAAAVLPLSPAERSASRVVWAMQPAAAHTAAVCAATAFQI